MTQNVCSQSSAKVLLTTQCPPRTYLLCKQLHRCK